MIKSKRQSKNFFHYLLDEFILFRRDFYFVTTADPDMLATELYNLPDKKRRGWQFNPSRITISTEGTDESLYFELHSEQQSKGGAYEKSAKAAGTLYIDAGKTILEGTIVMGSRDYWIATFVPLIIIGLAFGFLLSDSYFWNIWIPLSIFVVVCLWLQAYHDRNHLYKLIQETVESVHVYD